MGRWSSPGSLQGVFWLPCSQSLHIHSGLQNVWQFPYAGTQGSVRSPSCPWPLGRIPLRYHSWEKEFPTASFGAVICMLLYWFNTAANVKLHKGKVHFPSESPSVISRKWTHTVPAPRAAISRLGSTWSRQELCEPDLHHSQSQFSSVFALCLG